MANETARLYEEPPLLTLYTTPVVYIYLDRLQTWLFGKKKPAIDESANVMPAE